MKTNELSGAKHSPIQYHIPNDARTQVVLFGVFSSHRENITTSTPILLMKITKGGRFLEIILCHPQLIQQRLLVASHIAPTLRLKPAVCVLYTVNKLKYTPILCPLRLTILSKVCVFVNYVR